MTQPNPADITAMVHASVPAIERLGITVEAVGPGRVDLRVPIEPNRNHIGTMYATALFALVELPGGVIPLGSVGDRAVPIVLDVQITFLAAARSDVRLRAEMDPEHLDRLADQAHAEGSADFVLELTGYDESDRAVVKSRSTYRLKPIPA